MVLSEKPLQMDGGALESESKKWVTAAAGMQLRGSLKSIFTIPSEKAPAGAEGEEECSRTPTSEEARIPSILKCPPAPRKPKPSSRCHYNGVKEFFNPPDDLDTVFIRRRSERA